MLKFDFSLIYYILMNQREFNVCYCSYLLLHTLIVEIKHINYVLL